jgi:hypothetical protein
MGRKSWYIVDGYKPPKEEGGASDYEGHECIMILNCNDEDANIIIDVFFMDKEPRRGLKYVAKANRISTFRSDDKSVFGDLVLREGLQYSLRISSNTDVVVQYGCMDVNQANLAYIATLGFSE